ncbi:hypothetical protein M408DRAFT_200181 [Serendipita vermifera MAFF 305830]|uniref:Uncharacterized protein n=1 Tax=Serendipita vermifera MAFF 305830 TaxID=933852 RepID=A0A0C3ANG1_SERVB|nr:hypothetical protein M408DRAFT_200181 [Serendipita vermifera MAFF 305830]
MPKREPTPPPGDDEPYYFSVLNPWPPNANMELPGDMYRFVLWLAAAMDDTANRDTKYRDNHPLWAVFHKPSAPRLVIIEVSRRYPNVRRLLGQHFWGGPKGFLMDPSADENYSAIFYCHYTTGRQVEKNGWKRKWISSDMFLLPGEKKKNDKEPGNTPGQPEDEKCEDTPSQAVPSEGDDTHSQTEDKEPGDTPEQPEDEKCDDTPSQAIPGKSDDTPSQPGDKKEDPKPLPQIFKKPYPATTYLLVPATDPTAVEFCRHLPLGLFPEAELNKTKPVIPPVGSATWAVKKDQRPLSNNQEKTGPPKAASTSSPITEAVCDAAAVEPKESEPQDLWAGAS